MGVFAEVKHFGLLQILGDGHKEVDPEVQACLEQAQEWGLENLELKKRVEDLQLLLGQWYLLYKEKCADRPDSYRSDLLRLTEKELKKEV